MHAVILKLAQFSCHKPDNLDNSIPEFTWFHSKMQKGIEVL